MATNNIFFLIIGVKFFIGIANAEAPTIEFVSSNEQLVPRAFSPTSLPPAAPDAEFVSSNDLLVSHTLSPTFPCAAPFQDKYLIMQRNAESRIDAYSGTELSKTEIKEMLVQLLDHPVGCKIFFGKGLDGISTQFIIQGSKAETNPVMRWMLYSAPTVLATRERFGIFKIELQKHLRNNAHFASVPCGGMLDLLELDLTGLHNVFFYRY